MRIASAASWTEAVPLTVPYEISSRRIESVELVFLRLETDGGLAGLGSASPAREVTGESPEACCEALGEERLAWLRGRDPRELEALGNELARSHSGTPAARAAVDMALHDLAARARGVALVDLFGRRHDALPTSVTIGIASLAETLAQAEGYLGRGFRCLKVKTGRSFDEDVARLSALRAELGPRITIRIDANQGCSPAEARRLEGVVRELGLELVEQPLPRGSETELRALPAGLRRLVAADESLHDEDDARSLAAPPPACGIFNIKLMKCGGPGPARAIARIAEAAGIELMWGCNDESAISIAAALHTAYACPATRYLDLDGSFDLARDPAAGGFEVVDGRLRLLERPGLGVELGG
ncbi:MAG: dipeptide epimerase [Thermoanaerobaculales bacterium]|nr:dipeptide epimerase [Thermoanaerobaculales bacterium]